VILHCIVCTGEIPEKRRRHDSATCGAKCARELRRLKDEEARRDMRGNTCLTCLRYIPYTEPESRLRLNLRFGDGLWHGNAARFA
jgi:hypothetical protein